MALPPLELPPIERVAPLPGGPFALWKKREKFGVWDSLEIWGWDRSAGTQRSRRNNGKGAEGLKVSRRSGPILSDRFVLGWQSGFSEGFGDAK